MTEGPGVYLARWQSLLDETLITPAAPRGGAFRKGRDVKHTVAMGKTGVGGGKMTPAREGGGAAPASATTGGGEAGVEAPDVSVVVEVLGGAFRELVRERARVLRGMGELKSAEKSGA